MLEFLDANWFMQARRFEEALPLQPGVDARIRYVVDDGRSTRSFVQLIGNGQILWVDSDVADADVEIRWSCSDTYDVFDGRLADNAAVAATTIAEDRATGRYEGPPPPIDFAHEPALQELPEIPGGDLRVVFEYTRGPFGTTHYHLTFDHGRVAALSLGLLAEADVAVSLPFRRVMRFQRGEISMLETLRDGTIRGSEGALGLFAGILESAEYQRALRATTAGPAPLALAALGDVVAQPAYRDLMRDLMSQTRRPLASGSLSPR